MTLSDPLTDADYTGGVYPSGALVIVRDVDIAGYPDRAASVWARVAMCEPDSPTCEQAIRLRELD
jgi:hypothetical protein